MASQRAFWGKGRILLVLIAAFLASTSARAAEQLVLRVEAKGWGNADPEDIEKVLASVGRELLRHVPPERPIRVHVVSATAQPQVDYRRAADGEFTIRLAIRDRHWSQFAFQFAHELAHIVSHYERRQDNHLGAENQWFEEAVGEAASLFVLTRMAQSWKTDPPYRNWKTYAPALAEYAAKRSREVETPERDRMPRWFTTQRAALRADPYLRDRNRVVAQHLFEMLERDPRHWEAFRYLNLGRPDPANSLETYLENWYFSVPKAQKPFVKDVVDLLGIHSELITRHTSR